MLAYLNPQYLLSRLLERCGLDYPARVSFAAHVFAGLSFALAGILANLMMGHHSGNVLTSLWIVYCIIDERLVDGYCGGKTLRDLLAKTLIPAGSSILGHFCSF